MTERDDIEILRRAARGDRAALVELVTVHQRPVRAYVARLAPDPLTADDIAQDVFLAAIRGIERLDAEAGALPYLLGIARNLVRSEWRRRFRDAELAASAVAALEPRTAAASPSDGARLDALRGCLERLPVKMRDVVDRHYHGEQRCDQIARDLSMASGSVRASLARARTLLKDCVESKLGGTCA